MQINGDVVNVLGGIVKEIASKLRYSKGFGISQFMDIENGDISALESEIYIKVITVFQQKQVDDLLPNESPDTVLRVSNFLSGGVDDEPEELNKLRKVLVSAVVNMFLDKAFSAGYSKNFMDNVRTGNQSMSDSTRIARESVSARAVSLENELEENGDYLLSSAGSVPGEDSNIESEEFISVLKECPYIFRFVSGDKSNMGEAEYQSRISESMKALKKELYMEWKITNPGGFAEFDKHFNAGRFNEQVEKESLPPYMRLSKEPVRRRKMVIEELKNLYSEVTGKSPQELLFHIEMGVFDEFLFQIDSWSRKRVPTQEDIERVRKTYIAEFN